jgi:hypothetical protein
MTMREIHLMAAMMMVSGIDMLRPQMARPRRHSESNLPTLYNETKQARKKMAKISKRRNRR